MKDGGWKFGNLRFRLRDLILKIEGVKRNFLNVGVWTGFEMHQCHPSVKFPDDPSAIKSYLSFK